MPGCGMTTAEYIGMWNHRQYWIHYEYAYAYEGPAAWRTVVDTYCRHMDTQYSQHDIQRNGKEKILHWSTCYKFYTSLLFTIRCLSCNISECTVVTELNWQSVSVYISKIICWMYVNTCSVSGGNFACSAKNDLKQVSIAFTGVSTSYTIVLILTMDLGFSKFPIMYTAGCSVLCVNRALASRCSKITLRSASSYNYKNILWYATLAGTSYFYLNMCNKTFNHLSFRKFVNSTSLLLTWRVGKQ